MLVPFKGALRIKKTILKMNSFITFTKATSTNVLGNQEG